MSRPSSNAWLIAGGVLTFAVVLALRLTVLSNPRQASSALFVVPIVLWSLVGLRLGLLAAAICSATTALVLHFHDHAVHPGTLIPRIATFFIVAGVVGHHAALVRALTRRVDEQRFATQVNDQVLQMLLVARYDLRRAGCESPSFDKALTATQRIVSDRLAAEPQPGDLRVPHDARIAPDQRAYHGGEVPDARHDIEDRADCERLVRAFYERALTDPIIGFIFTDVAKLDLDAHIPVVTDFWETVLLGGPHYRGGAYRPHAVLDEKVTLRGGHFARWLALWTQSVDELFAGPTAEEAKRHAARVANAFRRRLAGLPDEPGDAEPALLTIRRY